MSRTMNAAGRIRLGLATLVAFAAFAGGTAGVADAAFGLSEFGVGFATPGGVQLRQAGSHGDLETKFAFNTKPSTVYEGYPEPEQNVKDIEVALPPGFVVNATAAGTCKQSALIGAQNGNIADCPIGSQVGIAEVETFGLIPIPYPIYNVERPADLPALLAFNVQGIVVEVRPSLRPTDGYAITANSPLISQGQALNFTDVTLWGVPANPVHDGERFSARDYTEGTGGYNEPRASQAPELPFVSAPTSCPGGPATFAIAADSWQAPGVFSRRQTTADVEGGPLTTTGCENLGFDPSASARPLTRAAAQPAGFAFELDLPQNESPAGLATADVKQVTVKMPEGVTVSSAAASGLGACGPEQIGLGTNDPVSCPASSQIGTASVDTPLLDEPLTGSVYLASQRNNPFGSLLAVYLVLEGPGILIKLPGRIDADASNGRLTATFADTPQLPFSHLAVQFRGGSTAPLTMPSSCGTYTTRTEVTSWASPTPIALDSSFKIDEGCSTGGFGPHLSAGSGSSTAGGSTSFYLRVTQASGEADLQRIEASLPPGLLAKLAGVPLCDGGAAGSGNCPAASQIGSVTIGAGTGPSPAYLPEAGKAPTALYLGGPYRGSTYSLIAKVPAQAGPFDLGTVVVRNALSVDPVTTQVTVASDPLPQILEGIPVTYRDLLVKVDRPDFVRNPTSCEGLQVGATLTSVGGRGASAAVPFRATDCASLAFGPRLGLRLRGGTKRGRFPSLDATLTYPKQGNAANIRRAVVALPHSEFLEQGHIGTVCTRVQFASGPYPGAACPGKSVYGRASVQTPLLDQPLSGPVYLRSSSNKLPDLVVALHGAIDVVLDGRIDSVRGGGIRTTFATVPDAPISRFALHLAGGKRGLLVNSTDVCDKVGHATVELRGQNGAAESLRPRLRARCGKR